MIWEVLLHACSISDLGSQITKEKFPLFLDYVERMKQTETVKKGGYLPPEAHIAFVKSAIAGAHDYGTADVDGTGVTVYAKKKDWSRSTYFRFRCLV